MSRSPTSYRFATVSSEGVYWRLKRNCSITPRQMCVMVMTLACVSLAVASFFWFQGALLVLPFAVLEVVALAVALVVFARHATDAEQISLANGELVVEWEFGGLLQRATFAPEWVRVEHQAGDGSLIQVSGHGRSVTVGRHIRPDMRSVLAREIRHALRGA